jgi:Single-strand binding protein family
MNEITIHGNLTADPVLREGQSGKPFLTCTVAVNRSYYAAERGTRVDLPAVFHSVIAVSSATAAHGAPPTAIPTTSATTAVRRTLPSGAATSVSTPALRPGPCRSATRPARSSAVPSGPPTT